LVAAIQQTGRKVALETSGTEVGHVDAGIDWVCVSPKIGMPGGKVVLPAALAVADEIKHVVGRERDIEQLDGLLTAVALKPDVQICLQPVSVSPKATALCLETVQQRGWRLSVQMHKYIGAK
jgi:7-carboxy-7-deazaguanine synthase